LAGMIDFLLLRIIWLRIRVWALMRVRRGVIVASRPITIRDLPCKKYPATGGPDAGRSVKLCQYIRGQSPMEFR
jgi:hypothetical protein